MKKITISCPYGITEKGKHELMKFAKEHNMSYGKAFSLMFDFQLMFMRQRRNENG